MKNSTVLNIQNMSIAFAQAEVVSNVSFKINSGEILCLVGESGSGKSLSSLAAMKLLPEAATFKADNITFNGTDINDFSEKQMQSLRGKEISMIFQEPMTALNPVLTVGEQVAEVFEVHTNLKKADIKERVLELFRKVKIPTPEQKYNAYPFELSGGQRQRVMIAMALALQPKLLIADEPTTALDATVQQEILRLIKDLQTELGTAVLFITHDFGVVEEIADHVVVMEKGHVVEQGAVDDLMQSPKHPYTQKLLAAMPRLKIEKSDEKKSETLLHIKNVNKTFKVKEGGFFSKEKDFQALNNVSLTLNRGETLGIVGESGSGKSTLARAVVKLHDVDSGQILFNGSDITTLTGSALKAARRHMQMVFQDPFSSLNPRMRIGETIAEGLRAHKILAKSEIRPFVENLLEDVGLPKESYDRYPHQFSGGQRQRIGIARAIALKPSLIIADEAVSALDVSIQKQILELFQHLKKKYGLSYLFISHDLRVISQICDHIVVMKDGEIVEQGSCYNIFSDPQHAYTRTLLDSIPSKEKRAC